MNEQAVEALREAMEPPTWWTNRARLSPREVLERLEAQGYRLVPIGGEKGRDVAPAERAGTALNPAEEAAGEASASPPPGGLGRLMTELDSRVSGTRQRSDETADEAARRSA